jgi:hypothetical protein
LNDCQGTVSGTETATRMKAPQSPLCDEEDCNATMYRPASLACFVYGPAADECSNSS